jgi:hypothetical protein
MKPKTGFKPYFTLKMSKNQEDFAHYPNYCSKNESDGIKLRKLGNIDNCEVAEKSGSSDKFVEI